MNCRSMVPKFVGVATVVVIVTGWTAAMYQWLHPTDMRTFWWYLILMVCGAFVVGTAAGRIGAWVKERVERWL